MRKLAIISNLVYSFEGKLGWCPKPPTLKAGSATHHEDGGNKLPSRRWWVFFLVFDSAYGLVYGLAPSFVQFYVRLVAGVAAMFFFGIVGLANIVHAYKEKENIYYLRIAISFLMCFVGVSFILGNFLLALILFVTTIAIVTSGMLHHGIRHLSPGVAETK